MLADYSRERSLRMEAEERARRERHMREELERLMQEL
jgi:hypothetical protein